MDIAAKGNIGLLTTITLLHLQQIIKLFALILFMSHIVMDNPHAAFADNFESTSQQPIIYLFGYLGIGWGQFLFALLYQASLDVVKITHYQALKQQSMPVIEQQGDDPPGARKPSKDNSVCLGSLNHSSTA